VLGETIFGFRVVHPVTNTSHSPPWPIVLNYEHQLRKHALQAVMTQGLDLDAALQGARKDLELKERFFLTPTAMTLALSTSSPSSFTSKRPLPAQEEDSRRRGPAKGKGKGRLGKGNKSKGQGAAWHSVTPDGRKICFAWNSQEKKCRGSCGFVHCCQLCFGSHPAHSCKKTSAPAENPAS
jgi:hypothetical protein